MFQRPTLDAGIFGANTDKQQINMKHAILIQNGIKTWYETLHGTGEYVRKHAWQKQALDHSKIGAK